jgi:hypothetical protein
MEDFCLFYGHLVYFAAIWLFGKKCPVLVCCTEKNLATLNIGTIWYILRSCGKCIFPVLVRRPEKNLATLVPSAKLARS